MKRNVVLWGVRSKV